MSIVLYYIYCQILISQLQFVGISLDVNDLHSIEAPPALTDNDELEDNDDGVDDSRVIELRVKLSKKSRKCLPYFYVTSLY